MSKIKVCSLFSGIGGFETGIFNAIGRENVEVVFASEIDKYATKAYEIIYGFKPHGDITKISAEHIPDHDVLVGGFPCQAFSVAGKRLGFEDTRGTLFFEIVRIASKKKPKALILENVKGLVNHNKGSTLETILLTLSDIGYVVDFQVINSKHFDVPQNRERIIIVALRDIEAEEWIISGNDIVAKAKKKLKNADGIKTFNFKFPEQNKVNKIIKDILEDNVDEKYYISEEKTRNLLEQLTSKQQESLTDRSIIDPMAKGMDGLRIYSDMCPTLQSRDYKEPRKVVEIDLQQVGYIDKNAQGNRVYDTNGISATVASQTGGLGGSGGGVYLVKEPELAMVGLLDIKGNECIRRVYDPEGISPTITTMEGGNREPKIIVEDNDYLSCSFRTRSYKGQEQQLEIRSDAVSNTITSVSKDSMILEKPKYRIRKLTPLECFRLQGFPDEYYHKLVEAGISNSQLYKMAGNAVTTNKITAVFKNLINYI
ncbi:DNA (cytosine-5-)-methyltransferase [Brevibacillus gelatini]|uniref:Cytosine-specific methyltransferase n=1 Tax=Brevibacillus gelatini TaxID=1655277 RepID=A0A3M8B7Z2_9BACL|nr:DNA (cytosine-5-)-methyltransferase [Brevibacillus gelatini]RNB59422.1 DNA (cytosine-5-)-methyltransferase [Brevibacillus gelatini]